MPGALEARHPIKLIDGVVEMDEATHTYRVRGEVVPRSTTKLVSDAMDPNDHFDADLIIEKNLASWKSNKRSKYFPVVDGKSDEDATAELKNVWNDANRLGTKLHAHIESHLNDEEPPDDVEIDAEWKMVEVEFKKLQELGWVPFRSELSMYYTKADGSVTIAGQADAIFKDAEGNSVIVDWKRTNKDLSQECKPFKDKRCAAPVLEQRLANDHTKYSLQTSVYAIMYHQLTGVKIGRENRWLLQAHPSLGRAKWTQASYLDDAARELLEKA
jgi:hypothetical protein